MKRKIFISILIGSILVLAIFFLYNVYNKIEIKPSEYEIEKTQSTIVEQTVENEKEKSITTADMLEKTIKSVVGVSKLKDAGSSIFLKTTENELGLGTGFIVSSDGYIVSNEHVTGEKYSKCYITLENGQTYNGTVVWSDGDLDLSILKIEAKKLDEISLGDSDIIRVGETTYAIRKSYTDLSLGEQ